MLLKEIFQVSRIVVLSSFFEGIYQLGFSQSIFEYVQMDIGEYSDIRSLSTVLQLYGGRYIKILLSILHMACLSTKVARQILLSTKVLSKVLPEVHTYSTRTCVFYLHLDCATCTAVHCTVFQTNINIIIIWIDLLKQILIHIQFIHIHLLYIHTNTLSRYILQIQIMYFSSPTASR